MESNHNVIANKLHRVKTSYRISFSFLVGGDPTGTGRGGASIYGKSFDDEIHPDLKHTGKSIHTIKHIDHYFPYMP